VLKETLAQLLHLIAHHQLVVVEVLTGTVKTVTLADQVAVLHKAMEQVEVLEMQAVTAP
jgi:hypothetical protein